MRILVLPGDGIGPEITNATMDVLQAADKAYKLGLEYVYEDMGFASLKKHGTTIRPEVLDLARKCDGIMLGPQSHMDYPPVEEGGHNVSAAFRVKLDLYANVRPARTREFLNLGCKKMDLVIMREATEGFYPDRNMFKGLGEFMPTPDVAISMRKLTSKACERIARRAFELAMRRKKKVTAVHKANNFRITDQFFLDHVRAVAKDFPEVTLDDRIVDAMAAHLVRDPSQFDVIVATNFYSDILSDLSSELSGGLGLAGSVNANEELCCAQAQHGSAPDIEGQNKANPISMILSTAMLISWIGEKKKNDAFVKAGAAMDKAVDAVLMDPQKRTSDLGGKVGTDAFGKFVAAEITNMTGSRAA